MNPTRFQVDDITTQRETISSVFKTQSNYLKVKYIQTKTQNNQTTKQCYELKLVRWQCWYCYSATVYYGKRQISNYIGIIEDQDFWNGRKEIQM